MSNKTTSVSQKLNHHPLMDLELLQIITKVLEIVNAGKNVEIKKGSDGKLKVFEVSKEIAIQ